MQNPTSTMVMLVAVATLVVCSCKPAVESGLVSEHDPKTPLRPHFEDRSTSSGLTFVHHNGMSGQSYLPEITGSGAALFDADNDGDLDLYLVQGRDLGPPEDLDEVFFAPQGSSVFRDRILRNDLASEIGGLREPHFVDVTDSSGLRSTGYGMGVAAGDVDNDGWTDLYVTNLGPNRLLLNRSKFAEGGIAFEDVTEQAGVGDPSWSVSATFVDLDLDGWLDLYVGNYAKFSGFDHRVCRSDNGAVDYCGPLAFDPQPDRLYRNLGLGSEDVVRFEDASSGTAVERESGGSLGVITADFDSDGWPDLYVANDERPNLLWRNQGDGRLRNEAMIAGCAVNGAGKAEASMGVGAADFDGDGDIDIFLTHLSGETHTLYLNDGKGLFEDGTVVSGIGALSWKATGFGTAFLDYDNDGWLDLLVVNGAVKTIEELASRGDPFPLHQPNQLFRNRGDGRYEEVTALAGEAFEVSEVSRGAALGDIDNDGDTDVIICNNNGRARLLLNRVGQERSWLGLQLIGKNGNNSSARLEIELAGGITLSRSSRTDGSYASASDPRVVFGLGEQTTVPLLRVYWPDGVVDEWSRLEVDRYHVLRWGKGKAETFRGDW